MGSKGVKTRRREKNGSKDPPIQVQDSRESGALGGRKGERGVEAEVGAMEEGGEFGEAEGEAFGGGGAEGNVSEFAARAG